MPDLRKVLSSIWVPLGVVGIIAAGWDLFTNRPPRGEAITSDVMLLVVSAGAVIGGAASFARRRSGDLLLFIVATIVGLYCAAFQLMVSLEFGRIFFLITTALFGISALTIWRSVEAFVHKRMD